jgi:uncharacterized iron-regulated membrane protein
MFLDYYAATLFLNPDATRLLMKRLRKIIFWGHLTAGVLAGIVILIMSATGVLLTFQPQIITFAERSAQTAQPPQTGATRLGPRELLLKVKEARPDINPTGLTLRSDPSASASVALGREGVLYVNPYTGEMQDGEAKRTRAFFRSMEDWHRWLGTGESNRAVGRAITGACNAAFLVLAFSGVYLWWPKKWTWRNLKPVVLFRRGLSGRARDFNWHNVIGLWSSLLLVLLTATALVMSYQWANNLLYTLTGSTPPVQQAPQAGGSANAGEARRAGAPAQGGEAVRTNRDAFDVPANLNQLWARAEGQTLRWEFITLRLPLRADAPVSFSIREGGKLNPLATSTLTLNPVNAEVVKSESYAELSLGRRLRSWVRATHTGEAGRLPGQIIALAASLGGCVLVYTGIMLALRRMRSWFARRSGAGVISAAPTAESSD